MKQINELQQELGTVSTSLKEWVKHKAECAIERRACHTCGRKGFQCADGGYCNTCRTTYLPINCTCGLDAALLGATSRIKECSDGDGQATSEAAEGGQSASRAVAEVGQGTISTGAASLGATSLKDEIEKLTKELDEARRTIHIMELATPMEEDLSNEIAEMHKYLAMQDGFTLAGIARLLTKCQQRMAADWHEIGRERMARNKAEAALLVSEAAGVTEQNVKATFITGWKMAKRDDGAEPDEDVADAPDVAWLDYKKHGSEAAGVRGQEAKKEI